MVFSAKTTTAAVSVQAKFIMPSATRLAISPAQQPGAPAAAPGESTPLLLDVTDPAEIESAAHRVAGHTGRAGLDGLVNNAGIGVFGPLEIIPIEQFRRQMEVNVTGQLAMTQAFLPLLRLARGRIVLIGSIGTRFTPPFTDPVLASKSTIATMAETLCQELAPWDIRVVLIEPTMIHTEAGDKLGRDAERLMSESTSAARALYEDAFRRFVRIGLARERKGSPPKVVAQTVARADRAPAPRPLRGRQGFAPDSHPRRGRGHARGRNAAPEDQPLARTHR